MLNIATTLTGEEATQHVERILQEALYEVTRKMANVAIVGKQAAMGHSRDESIYC